MTPQVTAASADLQALFQQPEIKTLDIHGIPHVTIPEGIELKNMESLLPEPLRIKRATVAHDIRGLIAYVQTFKNDRTAIYCSSVVKPSIEAKLDDHRPDKPSHITHSVNYPCPFTHEWATWVTANKQKMGQVGFGEFIESNLNDIVEPAGSDLLAAVLDFKDSTSRTFRSATRLKDGLVQYQFIEKGETDAGQIVFPDQIKLGVPVFEGQAQKYAIRARLRSRITEGALSLWYELDRPDRVMRDAYDALIAQVEKETGLSVCRTTA